MQIKIKDSKKVVFQPVTIEVTLETMNELKSLWCYLNQSPKSIKSNITELHMIPDSFVRMDCLWNEIDKEIHSQS